MDKQRKKEETLKLIALFREHEVLWNRSCSTYRRVDLKNKALEEIAAKCNSTAETVKKRIKALRSTYIIEKKKIDQSKMSGNDATSVYESSLCWFKEMAFLDNIIVIRKPIDNNERNTTIGSPDIDDTTNQSIESDVSYAPSSSKRKRKRKVKEVKKFDEALDKLVCLTKPTTDVYSAFAECMVMQLRSMPEKVAYRSMVDMQNLLYKRKFENKRSNPIAKPQRTKTPSQQIVYSDTLIKSSPESRYNESDDELFL